jgi:two-component system, NarL family, response regulator NreC
MTKIVLADDHQVVRRGIKTLLSTESDFDIIGEAGNGLETVDLVTKLQPDILVLDLGMPGINGLEVTRQLDKSSPGTGILVLSMYNNQAYVTEALLCGARAYIVKEASSEELVPAIREVIAGHRYLSASLSPSIFPPN